MRGNAASAVRFLLRVAVCNFLFFSLLLSFASNLITVQITAHT